MSTLNVIVGTRIYISATLPATYTQAGYEALTFSEIAEITDINEFGKQWDKVEHTPLATAGKQKYKSFFDEGNLTLPLARSESDAGQILALAAMNATNQAYSFKIAFQGGAVVYFSGQVFGFTDGNVNTMRGGNITIEIDAGTKVEVAGGTYYTLSYIAGANGSIIGSDTQTVISGGNGVAVYAAPAVGYVFSQWSDTSTDNPRQDTSVSGSLTVTATFVSA